MARYRVHWVMDIEGAETTVHAAEKAWKFMRNDGSLANSFSIINSDGEEVLVDLSEAYGDAGRPEDMADLAPEMLKALRDMVRAFGDPDDVQAIADRNCREANIEMHAALASARAIIARAKAMVRP